MRLRRLGAEIEPMRWEERFYSAHDGFQAQIARSIDCDIVVAILRGRLGTPLPPDFSTAPAARGALAGGSLSERHGLSNPLPPSPARRSRAGASRHFRLPLSAGTLGGAGCPRPRRNRGAMGEARSVSPKPCSSPPRGISRAPYQTFHRPTISRPKSRARFANGSASMCLGPCLRLADRDQGLALSGLEPFGAKHAEVFFGRDGDRARALDRLKDAAEAGFPFLLIVGTERRGQILFRARGHCSPG